MTIRLISIVLVVFLMGMADKPKVFDVIEGFPVVHDGDDLSFLGENKRVRLLGIDSFEGSQKCQGADGQCYVCGRRASQTLRQTLGVASPKSRASKPVSCQIVGVQNRTGRKIGICTVKDGDTTVDLSEHMLRSGWSVATTKHMDFDPALRQRYLDAFAEAKKTGAGVHAGVYVTPAAWKRRGKRVPCDR